MVYINQHHDNTPALPGMVGGGAICMCPTCTDKRHKDYLERQAQIEDITEQRFKRISEGCPWKSYLKCTVLHSAGRFSTLGGDACKADNCAFFYWEKTANSLG